MIKSQNIISSIFLMYLITTLTEWFVHKHIMHNNKLDPGHIRHHKSVKRNMKLDDKDFDEVDIKMGSHHTLLITTWSFISFNYILNHLCKVHVCKKKIIVFSVFLGIFYHQLWNKYHRKMHFEADYFKKTKNPYLKWMFENHAIHHLQKGNRKGNYNIVFPGGDLLMGDYRSDVDNTEYCKQSEHMHEHICQFDKKFKEIHIKI